MNEYWKWVVEHPGPPTYQEVMEFNREEGETEDEAIAKFEELFDPLKVVLTESNPHQRREP